MPVSIDQVLSCKALPSLPSVAVEVLALTRDPNVPLDKIAKVTQNDAALTAKVLRTVNSSYYGLAQRCATLNRAIGYLGVKTVKSLVLGFCLVDTTRGLETEGFDLNEYWRRGIYSATAARLLADATGATDPDEAFTACLFQDIGMLACYASMGAEYDAVLSSAPISHRALPEHERLQFGFDHTEVGVMLAEKWNLAGQHVAAIRHHHDPDGAEDAFRNLVRIVVLGNMVAETTRAEIPSRAAAALVVKAQEWFGRSQEDIAALLDRVSTNARQLAKEFEKDIGPRIDVASVMAEANGLLLETSLEVQQEAVSLRRTADDAVRAASTDALTGVNNRKQFDRIVDDAFAEFRRTGAPLSLLFIDADKFKSINDTHGHAAGDAVLKELARRLGSFSPKSAKVCRYGGEEFGVVLAGLTLEAATEAAERVRAGVGATEFDISGSGAAVASIAVTISVGVSTVIAADETPVGLVRRADQGVYAAKRNGRNRVETVRETDAAVVDAMKSDRLNPAPASTDVPVPPAPAATTRGVPQPPQTADAASPSVPSPTTPVNPEPVADAGVTTVRSGPISVLLVEDDPLAGKLLFTLLSKRPNTSVRHVSSGEEALKHINGPQRPDLVVTDLRLPQMSGLQLIACARADARTQRIPMVVLSASGDPEDESSCLRAGAAFFMNKSAIVTDLNRAIAKIMSAAA